MAFVRSKLERIAGGLQQVFLYNGTADTAATMQASAYFNAIADEINAGDVIIMVGNNNGSIDNAVISSARGVTPVTTVGVEGVTAT